METASEYQNLPTNEKIRSQTGVFGGEVLVYGISQAEAEALIQFANDNGVAGEGHNTISVANTHLTADQKKHLREKGADVAADSIEVYLGHTTECHKPLYEMLGIQH